MDHREQGDWRNTEVLSEVETCTGSRFEKGFLQEHRAGAMIDKAGDLIVLEESLPGLIFVEPHAQDTLLGFFNGQPLQV